MADQEKDKVSTSPCCWLYLCCPPGAAAEALAAELGIPVETTALILERFRLVPVSMEAAPAAKGSASALAATEQLAVFNRRVRRELREILAGLGYNEAESKESL